MFACFIGLGSAWQDWIGGKWVITLVLGLIVALIMVIVILADTPEYTDDCLERLDGCNTQSEAESEAWALSLAPPLVVMSIAGIITALIS